MPKMRANRSSIPPITVDAFVELGGVSLLLSSVGMDLVDGARRIDATGALSSLPVFDRALATLVALVRRTQ